ncbi:MAG: hypothetical protein HY815_16045 [Candidatus Riflebacteria bacterium]|nr:hypothetical protein [Candidatus Riflebacteria bacterium]
MSNAEVRDDQTLPALRRQAVYALQMFRRIRRMLRAGCLQVVDEEAHPNFYRSLMVECQGLTAAIEEGDVVQEA